MKQSNFLTFIWSLRGYQGKELAFEFNFFRKEKDDAEPHAV